MEATTVLVPTIIYPQHCSRTAYGHIELRYLEYYEGKLKKYSPYHYCDNAGLARLTVSCQIDWGSGFESYAWRLGYECYSTLEIEELEVMLKTIKPIKKRFDKLVQEWGYPQTFGSYVHLIAIASKVKYMTFSNKEDSSLVSLLDGINWVDKQIVAVRERCKEMEYSA